MKALRQKHQQHQQQQQQQQQDVVQEDLNEDQQQKRSSEQQQQQRRRHYGMARRPHGLRERMASSYLVRWKADSIRGKIPKLLRSNYDQGGEVPFFSVWRAVFLEYIATTLFVFYACGSVVAASSFELATAAGILLAAITQGFAIATLVYAISHTSGGHINPAVTFALVVSNHMGFVRGCFYIGSQLLGGITGAALLSAILPGDVEGNLGTTVPWVGFSTFQGLLLEFLITFTLIFTIFGTAINKAGSASGTHSLAPLPIGFAVLIGVVVAYGLTGGSMNPARTFGPAVVSGTWTKHWIYWIGPLGAALIVGLLERFVLLVVIAPVQPAIVEELIREEIEQQLQQDSIPASPTLRDNPVPPPLQRSSFVDSQYPGPLRQSAFIPAPIMAMNDEEGGGGGRAMHYLTPNTNNNTLLNSRRTSLAASSRIAATPSPNSLRRRNVAAPPELLSASNANSVRRSSVILAGNMNNNNNDVMPSIIEPADEVLLGTGIPGDAGV